MSDFQDGIHLSSDEIQMILAMAGKQQQFIFPMEPIPDERSITETLCRLERDGILLGSQNGFGLEESVHQVMAPVVEASSVLLLTFSKDEQLQRMYYLGNVNTCLMPTRFGGFTLQCMTPAELCDDLIECLDKYLMFEESQPDECRDIPNAEGEREFSTQALLQEDAFFVLEHFEADSGKRIGFLRGKWYGVEPWLERIGKKSVAVRLTSRALRAEIMPFWEETP